MAGSDHLDLERRACSIVARTQVGSAALLQRRLGIGFSRAEELLERLAESGVVGPSKGPGRVRDVLILSNQLAEVLAADFSPTGGS